MQNSEQKNSIAHFAALAGLWFINILIVVFTLPFLIYKKIRDVFSKSPKDSLSQTKTQPKTSRRFPCSN